MKNIGFNHILTAVIEHALGEKKVKTCISLVYSYRNWKYKKNIFPQPKKTCGVYGEGTVND